MMRFVLASVVSAALLAGCATYGGPDYGYAYGYENPYYYDNGYYGGYYGYGPSYYYEPGLYGSFSYYNGDGSYYNGDGYYRHNYRGDRRSYQSGAVTTQPRTSVQSSTSSHTVRAHRDRNASQRIARAQERQRLAARAETRKQARNTRNESTRMASSGRVDEQREHGG